MNKLYNSESITLLSEIYIEIVPYFNTWKRYASPNTLFPNEYESLSLNTKRIFKDIVFEKYQDLKCEKNEMIELYDFLKYIDYTSHDTQSLFNRYIYNNRDDKEFMMETIHIHRDSNLLFDNYYLESFFKMLYLICGYENEKQVKLKYLWTLTDNPEVQYLLGEMLYYGYRIKKNVKRARKIFSKNKEHPDSIFKYAYMFEKGFGGEKDIEKAKILYLENYNKNYHIRSYSNYLLLENKTDTKKVLYELWRKNKCPLTLHQYGVFIEKNEGLPKAIEVYHRNYIENKYPSSIHSYAYILLFTSSPNKKEGIELFKYNYEVNKFYPSLEIYIECLMNGLWCEKNEKLGVELYKKCYIESGSINSFYNYGICCYNGVGIERNLFLARNIFEENWYRNKCERSLKMLIKMMKEGIGGKQNIKGSTRLIKYFKN